MRAVVQLVSRASVKVGKRTVGEIGAGLLVLLAVHKDDTQKDVSYLADKIANLRIFPDDKALMNRSILDVDGEMLVVSQFTLYGDCRKGRRPGFSESAAPEKAEEMYLFFIEELKKRNIKTASGEFQAMMEVSLVNNGPVTILLDSKKLF